MWTVDPVNDFCLLFLPYLVGAALAPLALVRLWDFAVGLIRD